MPNRSEMLCPPVGRYARAAWLDEHLPDLLRGIPLSSMRGGWAVVGQLERTLFPNRASDFLGGELDPACPACGVETDEGSVSRQGADFLVAYGCHTVVMSEAELRARVKPSAGNP